MKITNKPNQNRWYSPRLEHIKTDMRLAEGEEKKALRNIYVEELRKAKGEDQTKVKARNKKKGVWGILNRVMVIFSEFRLFFRPKDFFRKTFSEYFKKTLSRSDFFRISAKD